MPKRKPDTDARAPTEQATRTRLAWTHDLVRVAETQADSGQLRLAGDLCWALLGDGRIAGAFRTRVQALLGLQPTFEGSGDGRRRGRAVRALEVGDDWWEMTPDAEAFLVIVFGLLLGVGLAWLDWWETDETGRRVARMRQGRNVPRLHFADPRFLRLDPLSRRWLLDTQDGVEDVLAQPGKWLVYMPFGSHRPGMLGMWRGLATLWLSKGYAWDDRGRNSEKSSTIVATPSPDTRGVSREQRRELCNDLSKLGSDGVAVLPPGFALSLLEVSGKAAQLYSDQIADANSEFAIQILGHNLTSEVSGGSFAASETGNEVRQDLRRFDASTWSTCAHDHLLVPWSRTNYGDPELAPWPLYPVDPPEDQSRRAGVLGATGDAIDKLSKALGPHGLEPDAKAICEDAAIPTREVPKVAAEPPQEPQPAPPGAPEPQP